jgi:hypothetical protein
VSVRVPSSIQFAKDEDMPYARANMNMCSIAEFTLGFKVLCLPSMRKILVSAWIEDSASLTSSYQTISKERLVEYDLGESYRSVKATAWRIDGV